MDYLSSEHLSLCIIIYPRKVERSEFLFRKRDHLYAIKSTPYGFKIFQDGAHKPIDTHTCTP